MSSKCKLIHAGMVAKGRDLKGLRKKVSVACKQAGLDYHLRQKETMMYGVGKKVIYKKVKKALGLDRCIGFYSGAAAISLETLEYFVSLDIIIRQGFGMSETSGPHTFNMDPTSTVKGGSGGQRMLSVGTTMRGLKTRLHNIQEDGNGEIIMWGRNIMMGYLNREDKTNEEIDEDGFLHSGDLASMDKDGYVHITGRIKELLITSGGENIAPVPIEDNIKKELPVISNVVLIGDRQKFISAFITLKQIVDPKTDEPTRDLMPTSIDWCKSVGRPAIKTIDDVLKGDFSFSLVIHLLLSLL
jgi:long-chain-fatty-acid--CoA ligase ACSBG